MSSGEAAAAVSTPKPAPEVLAFNPNWAQLQQKLKARRPAKPSRSTDVGPETLVGSVLGKRKEREEPVPDASPPVALSPTSADFSLTDALAMDCEMVGVSSEGNKSAIGRVTLVNSYGNVVYDEYVRPMERIVDFRTRISGIRPKNMKKAKDFCEVQDKVAELIKGKLLVGHALHNDLKVLLLGHPKKDIRDTSEYELLRRGNRTRGLKHLAAEILGVNIQENEHCPIEDARAAMFIYMKYKKEWEKNLKKQFKLKAKLNKRKTKKKKKQMDAKKS
ncbi:RNA exonuclease 4-like [Zingiber officinale]|uniref:RNA exonuclease 4-like n=1 Tax=Zingiber officinale TaxID=94328 RepID=UPI001C4B65F0|nr:RNA exonuclease 4-like [Zingiber officinale]